MKGATIMIGKSHEPMHRILAQESDRRVMHKYARFTASVVTCFLTMTLAMSMIPAAPPADESAVTPAQGAADGVTYFPSQYTLNAPDAVPGHIEAF
jgi:hypothetical protein